MENNALTIFVAVPSSSVHQFLSPTSSFRAEHRSHESCSVTLYPCVKPLRTMALSDQTSLSDPLFKWALEQRLPAPSTAVGRSVYNYQSAPWALDCILACGSDELEGVRFRIKPATTQSSLSLATVFENSQQISAAFLTYDERDEPAAYVRQPHDYQGIGEDAQPAGPINFSRQLYHLQQKWLEESNLREKTKSSWYKGPGRHRVFRWRADDCVRFSWSLRLTGQETERAEQFKAIIRKALVTDSFLYVVTTGWAQQLRSIWPFFCSTPWPTPPSWWPWLDEPLSRQKEEDDKKRPLMKFGNSLERYSGFVDRAFARRKKDWNKPAGAQSAFMLSAPLHLLGLPVTTRFHSSREYLAHVLGSHSYECAQDGKDLDRLYNKDHDCCVIADEEGSNFYIIALSIEIPLPSSTTEEAANPRVDESAMPEIGEQVTVKLTLNEATGEEEWKGHVVRIPTAHAGLGYNVAILAERPPTVRPQAFTDLSKD